LHGSPCSGVIAMVFLVVGVLLLLLKLAEFGPVADLGWLWVLLPFGLAVLWWAFADSTGLTQRRAMAKMDLRKQQRRERDMAALGLDVRRDKRIRVLKDAAARKAPPAAPAPPSDGARRDPKI
jgi:small Trp-rich protein